MSDRTKTLAKIGCGLVGATVLGGPVGAAIGRVIGDVLGESFGKVFTGAGGAGAGVITNRVHQYCNDYLHSRTVEFNYDLARAFMKIWADGLRELLPANRVLDSRILTGDSDSSWYQESLISSWIDKFEEAQHNEVVLFEVFGGNRELSQKGESEVANTLLDAIIDERTAEEIFWNSLERTLVEWARHSGKYSEDWSERLPEPLNREVRTKLFSGLKTHIGTILKEDVRAWRAFEFAAFTRLIALIQVELAEIKEEVSDKSDEVNKELSTFRDEIGSTLTQIHKKLETIEPSAARDSVNIVKLQLVELVHEAKYSGSKLDNIQSGISELLKVLEITKQEQKINAFRVPPAAAFEEQLTEEVLTYLDDLARRATELPAYYPKHLCAQEDGHTLFDDIRQTVQVVTDREKFRNWLLKEKERTAGQFDNPTAYAPYKARPETEDSSGVEPNVSKFSKAVGSLRFRDENPDPPEPPVSWDERANERFKRVVIIGDPGFGKSWLLRYEARRVALSAAKNLRNHSITLAEFRLPVLARLSDLARYARSHTVSEALSALVSRSDGDRPFSAAFSSFVREKIGRAHV